MQVAPPSHCRRRAHTRGCRCADKFVSRTHRGDGRTAGSGRAVGYRFPGLACSRWQGGSAARAPARRRPLAGAIAAGVILAGAPAAAARVLRDAAAGPPPTGPHRQGRRRGPLGVRI